LFADRFRGNGGGGAREDIESSLLTIVEKTDGLSSRADREEVSKMISVEVDVDEERARSPPVDQHMKYHIKFARQNGIHVSPTTTLNGLVFDSSSSWGLEEWKECLDPYL